MKNDYVIRGQVTAIFVKYNGNTLETLIDTEDLSKVMQFPKAWRSDHKGYVLGTSVVGSRGRKQQYVRLHRIVMECPEGMYVDHINHNPLDNRKENLRVVTAAENNQNYQGAKLNNLSSGVRGVTWSRTFKQWVARVNRNGKVVYQKHFNDLEEARKEVEVARALLMPMSKEAKAELQKEEIEKFYSKETRNRLVNGPGGICFNKNSQKWVVRFRKGKEVLYEKHFKEFEEAALAYKLYLEKSS